MFEEAMDKKFEINAKELYTDILDKENSDFIDDHTYRVHFTDGVDIDLCNDEMHILNKVDNEDILNDLQEAAMTKRAISDAIDFAITLTIKDIKGEM